MEANYDYQTFEYSLIEEKFMIDNPTVTRDIEFNFSFFVVFSEWDVRQPAELEFIRQHHQPVINHVVRLSREQFWRLEETKRFVKEELIRVFLVEEEDERVITRLVNFAWAKARYIVMSNPTCCSVLYLAVSAMIDRQLWFVGEEIDYSDYYFRPTPASESSIEGLEVVAVDSCRNNLEAMCCNSCSICLEDYLSEEVLISLPCSHIFHGDCVKTWLRTSHYCPLCRFEMPLETGVRVIR